MYDFIIIGAGPGGYSSAFTAASQGASVCLLDPRPIGGTCLHTGCIPTKTLLASAHIYREAKHSSAYGVNIPETSIVLDWPTVQERKLKVINNLQKGLEQKVLQSKIDCVQDYAMINSVNSVVTTHSRQEIKGKYIIIASGSESIQLPALPFAHPLIIDSTDALNLSALPEEITIVGAGVIGCEFATLYALLGKQVTLCDRLDYPLGQMLDQDICIVLLRELKKLGTRFILGNPIISADLKDDGVILHFANGSTHTTRLILTAVGRKPCDISSLVHQNVILERDTHKIIVVDENYQTSEPNIYAIGDVNNLWQLAHAAEHQGRQAVMHALGKPAEMTMNIVPTAIFTKPEIGMVGLTESRLKEINQPYQIHRNSYRELGRAHSSGEISGEFKLLYDHADRTILGAQIIGAQASELISEVSLAMHNHLSIDRFTQTIRCHPTLAEGFGTELDSANK